MENMEPATGDALRNKKIALAFEERRDKDCRSLKVLERVRENHSEWEERMRICETAHLPTLDPILFWVSTVPSCSWHIVGTSPSLKTSLWSSSSA
jgi:hypothetical protein